MYVWPLRLSTSFWTWKTLIKMQSIVHKRTILSYLRTISSAWLVSPKHGQHTYTYIDSKANITIFWFFQKVIYIPLLSHVITFPTQRKKTNRGKKTREKPHAHTSFENRSVVNTIIMGHNIFINHRFPSSVFYFHSLPPSFAPNCSYFQSWQ